MEINEQKYLDLYKEGESLKNKIDKLKNTLLKQKME